MRLLIVQYGDYHAALTARAEGGSETYRAQFYSLDAVDGILGDGKCLVVGLDQPPSDATFGNYRVVGGDFLPRGSGPLFAWSAARAARRIIRLAGEFAPSHVILRTPGWVLSKIGGWAVSRGMHVLPLLADYFPARGIRAAMRNLRVVHLLNVPSIPLVGNHNYPACRSLVRAGVAPEKVVPWDWPPAGNPHALPPKGPPEGTLRLFYAGTVSEAKGVGDLLRAAGIAAYRALEFHLDVCGTGPELGAMQDLAERLGIADRVSFRGQTANETVLSLLSEAHISIVPSRPEYPEGLPGTVYEAFETRTPLIASSHPTFAAQLTDGCGCLFFKPGDPKSLAGRILRLAHDPRLYAELSRGTAEAWEAIRCPVTFGEMLAQWAEWTENGTPIPCLAHSAANWGRAL